MKEILVYTTVGPTDPTRAGIAFAYAATASKQGNSVTLFLFHDAVLLARKEMSDAIVPIGPPPIKELSLTNVKIYVCSACYELRGLKVDQLMENAELQGIGKFVELSMNHTLVPF